MTNYEKIKTLNKTEIAAMLATCMMASQVRVPDHDLFMSYFKKHMAWLDEEAV